MRGFIVSPGCAGVVGLQAAGLAVGGVCGGDGEEDGHRAAHSGEVAVGLHGSAGTGKGAHGERVAYLYRLPHEGFGGGLSTVSAFFAVEGHRLLGAGGEQECCDEQERRHG